ncbi:MAG: phosphoenolpyruvate--protein phosphotransferase [Gammaproteobacteria bacterium]
MSITLHGVGVSHGIAIGRLHILERDKLDIPEYRIKAKEVDTEITRLDVALEIARAQLRAVREHIPCGVSDDIADFIDAHLLMLNDSVLSNEPGRLIRNQHCNAEWALKLLYDSLVNVFDQMADPYLRTRKDDIYHVVYRIQRILLNQAPMRHEVPDSRLRGYIILAEELTPADTVLMQHHGIAAFATEGGGPTSHTAILARSLGIPSIVGLHEARRYAQEADLAIVDGANGVLLIAPDEKTLAHYKKRQQKDKRHYAKLITLKEMPTVTQDGVVIELNANIELPGDFAAVREVGAQGVGLYRTEFMYMNRETPPNEEEHYHTYAEVLRALDNRPVTIRTFDLGADKQTLGLQQEEGAAENPALGLRAIRLCLRKPALFRPQLRAILRVSALGPVRLMIPMLSSVGELKQVLQIVDEIRAELRSENMAFDPDLAVGAMIEVPAAAVCADAFAREVDFLSIGTNDLIQYAIAIDRLNEEVNYLYDPMHPGVLRLIWMTIKAGQEAGTPVAMCGEMAGDPRFVRLLLGLGLREFSVHPAVLLEVKRIISESRIEALEPLALKALGSADGSAILKLLHEQAGNR